MAAFLTDEWFDAVIAASADHEHDADAMPAKINLVVTGADAGEVQAHLDTTDGLTIGKGHLDPADVTLTLPLAIAQKMLIEGDQQAGMQAFMSGQLKVDGDITKVMAIQGEMAKPGAVAMREKIQAVTD